MREATSLGLGNFKPPKIEHWRALGSLVARSALPRLEELSVASERSEPGLALLSAGLRGGGSLPSLTALRINHAHFGPEGATALAAALTKRALPRLRILNLSDNPLGDAGMAALAPALPQLPELAALFLNQIGLGDGGLAALLAEEDGATSALKSFGVVHLAYNQITDEGCAALVTALGGGALAAMSELWLEGNPASKEARATVMEVLRESTYCA